MYDTAEAKRNQDEKTQTQGRICRLVGRHWLIEDSSGHVSEVPKNSPGVVGHSPVLTSGQRFVYHSGCSLATETGTMSGSFQMVEFSVMASASAPYRSADPMEAHPELTKTKQFDACIDPFVLAT
eukprot:SAG31_NODE_4912_length_2871_cov_2.282468_2_plen_125_part_00